MSGFVAFGNDELAQQPRAQRGDVIRCPHCGGNHILVSGTVNGLRSERLLFYSCGETDYLAAVAGRSVMGLLPRSES